MSNIPKPREFTEVEGGKYDDLGFYHTPNGSFWDCDGVYFNKDGKDVHGGFYDDKLEYHPGEGWIDSLMCYEDEVNPNNKDLLNNIEYGGNDGEDDYEDGDYDVYEDFKEDLKYKGNYSGKSYYDIDNNKKPEVKKIENKPQIQQQHKQIILQPIQKEEKPKEPEIKKEEKDIKEVKEALKNSKKVECQGFQISEDLLDSDDDQKGGFKNKKGKKY